MPNSILKAGPADESHRQAILAKVLDHTKKQIETVSRHYIEQQQPLGLSITDAEQLLQFAFLVRSSDTGKIEKFLLHPTTQYWLSAMRRVSGTVDLQYRLPVVRQAASLGTQLSVLNEVENDWKIALDMEGGLRASIFDRHLEFGQARANAIIDLQCRGDAIAIRFDDGLNIELPIEDYAGESAMPLPTVETDGFSVGHYILISESGTQLQRRDEWLRPHWTGTNERNTGTHFFGACATQYPEDFPIEPYREAMQKIEQASPEIAKDVNAFTPVLVPRTTGPHKKIGFTVLSRQGAMFLDPDEPDLMAENIIHENAHVKLRYMQLIDPILEDFYTQDDAERFSVPWRPDPRPLAGILEGAYVFSNVLDHRRKVGLANLSVAELERDIEGAISILAKHGKFTEPGQRFLHELVEWRHRPATP